MKTLGTALFLLFFFTFAPFTIYNYGWAGLVATILWVLILALGLGPAIMGEGIGWGLIGVLLGFFGFVVATTAMALFEWYVVGNREAAELITDDFSKACFGGRVITATYDYICRVGNVLNTSHPVANLIPVVLCSLGVIAGLIFKIVSRK